MWLTETISFDKSYNCDNCESGHWKFSIDKRISIVEFTTLLDENSLNENLSNSIKKHSLECVEV